MLRRYRLTLGLLLCTLVSGSLAAQTLPEKIRPRNIFEALEEPSSGEGLITIIQSSELRTLVGSVAGGRTATLGRDGNYTLLMGYRIQVFNSNLPNAKAEAYSRAEQLKRLAPSMSSYITYKAPFWKLTIGNFLTREEASQTRTSLVRTLPSWMRESYVVRDKVRILNYTDPNVSQ